MMNSNNRMVLVPHQIWKNHLADIARDAKVCERRIKKESNIDVERVRYSLFSDFIERWAKKWVSEEDVDILDLDISYIREIRDLLYQENKADWWQKVFRSRLMATFFSPKDISHHLNLLQNWMKEEDLPENSPVHRRVEVLQQVLPEGNEKYLGVVDIHSPFQRRKDFSWEVSKGKKHRKPDFSRATSKALLPEQESGDQIEYLRKDIRRAVKDPDSGVNFSNPSHPAITEVLHEFAYRQDGKKPCNIRVFYNDGSEGQPFPLYLLEKSSKEKVAEILSKAPIHSSLISMRHLDMDLAVDMAWFTNQRASRRRAYAETEEFCYQRTLDQLGQVKDDLHIKLYQTGLQPAVVGFYRAFVEYVYTLEDQDPRIVVTPMYYQKAGDYRKGKQWS